MPRCAFPRGGGGPAATGSRGGRTAGRPPGWGGASGVGGVGEAEQGVSSLDGFAEDNGEDTQMLDGDRELLSGLYAALNAELPPGRSLSPGLKYLRRAVGLWAEHPATLELQRTVMGEQGRGYTMLCSYAKCNGKNTGSCGTTYNWYSYVKHDCQHGGFDTAINQQIAQLGDH